MNKIIKTSTYSIWLQAKHPEVHTNLLNNIELLLDLKGEELGKKHLEIGRHENS